MNTDVNEGRGFPMADEPAPFTVAPHRVLLFDLVANALRSQQGILRKKGAGEKTDFFAGRRSAFISSAARLMAILYDGNYDEAKRVLKEGVLATGQGFTARELEDPDIREALAKTIVERALEAM